MRTARKTFGALAPLAAAAALALGLGAAPGCSTEQISLALTVSATPNPVSGVAEGAGRRWEYLVTVVNPQPVGVFLEYFHNGISDTDTGYGQPLQVERNFAAAGRRVPPGGTLSFQSDRASEGRFSRGTERRVYHGLGDDGKYYSGEVLIALQ